VCQPPEVAAFLAKYTPAIAAQTQAVREHLLRVFPRGFELVYDNYNALAFGFGPTQRASDLVVSVAAYPKWVTLFFLNGATLPDPHGVLQGSGTQVRSVRLVPVEVLHSNAVQDLLHLVAGSAREAFEHAPPLKTVVKSVSVKQRPRRPATAQVDATSTKARRGEA
jgi:hypothetical protein